MCGIVGLHLKNRLWDNSLGVLLAPMLTALTLRGPDSAGIALYSAEADPGMLKYSLRSPEPTQDWFELAGRLGSSLAEPVKVLRSGGQLATLSSAAQEADFLGRLEVECPDVVVVGYGRAMEVFKDVGSPEQILNRYGIADASGYQGIGHTRLATESAVTTEHSHPFTPAADLGLVHNGSFSNHATLRRRLEDSGVRFDTDNDSEVAARYIADRLEQGDDLGEALRMVLKDFDGFFTLLVSTRDQFAVVRDAFACKPLVVAETADYVAVASEYHALATLPDIESATVFEPQPEELHVWSR
jgi:methylamine---glutamate N-methyltransferase subunit A